mgnify:CR=1 FL=1
MVLNLLFVIISLVNFISDKNIAHLTRWRQINLIHVKYAEKPSRQKGNGRYTLEFTQVKSHMNVIFVKRLSLLVVT